MVASFLKENIVRSRLNDKTGKNVIRLLKLEKQSEFLLECNISVLTELIDFLYKSDDVWILTGYDLSGKSLLTSYLPQLLNEKTIYHNFKCTSSSTIDDILLTFFETLKKYAQKGLVSVPKIDTKNFQERINFYLTACENPFVIVLDGFNEIAGKKNKEEIMNFLSHVSEMEKVKMIITSRVFDITDLQSISLKVKSSIIKPLKLDNFKEYCLKNIVKSDSLEEFFDLAKGHYKNLSLAMSYIQPTNTTIKEFVDEANASIKNFEDFIISKNLSLVPGNYSDLMWMLALANFCMPKTNVMNLIHNEEEQINVLLKQGIIEKVDDGYFMKDFYRNEIVKTIEPLAEQNIKKAIVKFLEMQLPLKPMERELKLSRVTIRNEIERLNSIETKLVPKNVEKKKTAYLNILGYSKQFKTNWDGFDDIIMPKKDAFEDIINKNVKKVEEQIEPQEIEMVENNDDDVSAETSLQLAEKLQEQFSYKGAIVQYSEALTQAQAKDNKKSMFVILKNMGECYFKLGDYTNSIDCYGKAHEVAKSIDFVYESDYTMLKIADIYKLTFKQDLAKEIYTEILAKEDANAELKLRAEINLFELNFAGLKLKDIIEKYYDILEKANLNSEISSKIHFRLGFLYDRASKLEDAELHYKKSIEISDDFRINQNLSSCYYNLAEIMNEKRDFASSLSYYLKSFAIDEILKKTDDMLVTAKKIAKIYERRKNNLALEYYEKALDLAKTMNDNYPLACAYLDLGDYYYRQNQDLKALKIYMSAKKTMENQLTTENSVAINDRLNDLKVRMGKEVVENLIREFYE